MNFLGLITSNLIGVGTGVTIQATASTASTAKQVSMLDTLINIIPTNPFKALSEQNLLQIIFFALILGFSLVHTLRSFRINGERRRLKRPGNSHSLH
ncbi:MAG: dicarboxylate/amino acid:cation symporter [Synergistaceae bacterium]|nr:dicarboxylate/amino acid:cation symporter [Synergistaceae bacterium]